MACDGDGMGERKNLFVHWAKHSLERRKQQQLLGDYFLRNNAAAAAVQERERERERSRDLGLADYHLTLLRQQKKKNKKKRKKKKEKRVFWHSTYLLGWWYSKVCTHTITAPCRMSIQNTKWKAEIVLLNSDCIRTVHYGIADRPTDRPIYRHCSWHQQTGRIAEYDNCCWWWWWCAARAMPRWQWPQKKRRKEKEAKRKGELQQQQQQQLSGLSQVSTGFRQWNCLSIDLRF